MFAFWLGVAVICVGSVVPFMRELRSPDLEALKRGWRRQILLRWLDVFALSLIVGNFWLTGEAFDARNLGSGLVLAFLIAFGAVMLRLELFAWLLLWHGARNHARAKAAAQPLQSE